MKATLLFLLLLVIPVTAAEIVVPVEAIVAAPGAATVEIISRAADTKIEPMDLVRIWLDVPPDVVETIKCGCHPEPKFVEAGMTIPSKDKPSRPYVEFQAGRAGSFGVFVSWMDDRNHLKKYVIVTGGEPDPNPFPNPQPQPNPGKRKIIILEESSLRTAAQKTVIMSQKLRQYCQSKGHQFQLRDVDQIAPPALAPSSVLPRLIIEDGGGNVVYQCPLPATVDLVIETIKAHGG